MSTIIEDREARPDPSKTIWRGRIALIVGIALLVTSVGACVTVGSARLDVATVWRVIAHQLGLEQGVLPTQIAIVWEIRLPRVLLAMIIGAGLGLAGLVMQTLMRNPLADPYLLGLSSGASVGAVLVLVVSIASGALALAVGAFLGAVLSLALVLALAAGREGRLTPVRTVLAGVAVASFCSAITSFILVVGADSDAAKRVLAWTFGSLGGARWSSVTLCAIVLAGVTALVLAHARSLNSFVFGERLASTLGVNVTRTRWLLLTATALLTASLVAVAGTIGFVGLIVPHAIALVAPYDHRLRIPLTLVGGALFLTWVDAVARVAFAPREMPIGVMTALVGVPVFVVLLRRNRTVQ